ncbi:hypothetical protein ABEB36_014492 [Hypothenemus hampei]|uniref:MADF domain-containing protein n=1 Tax=Hypothenemus hampei TaxID=57062 RepID=A0ABD1E1Y1_HYPHA
MGKQFIIDFIEIYREFPCLWRVKSVEYRDRIKKNQTYGVLLEKYKEMDNNATLHTVKNKIHSLRGAFRKELKKIKDSQRSGAGADELQQPRLWYFNYLIFFRDQETPRETVSNIDDNDGDSAKMENLDVNIGSPISSVATENTRIENEISSISSSTYSSVSQENLLSINKKKRKEKRKSTNMAEEVLQKISSQLDSTDGANFDTSAKNIANELRTLSPETAIITEKLLTDILFEAQMGSITKHTELILQDTRSQFSQSQNSVEEYYSTYDTNYQI